VVRTTHAPGLHFQQRAAVLDSLFEELQRVVLRPLLDLLHGVIKNLLRDGLLAVPHHCVDEFLSERRTVQRIRQDFASLRLASAGHFTSSRLPSAAWHRTWSGSAYGRSRRQCRAYRGPRDS